MALVAVAGSSFTYTVCTLLILLTYLGQMYVAAMGASFGLPLTMGLGGALTWAAVGVAVWRIPTLWSYKDAPEAGDGEDKAKLTQPSV